MTKLIEILIVIGLVQLPGVHALTNAQALSIAAVIQTLGSLLFIWLGTRGEKNFFLFVGNLVCVIGCIVWVIMILEEEANMTWATFFGCLAIVNAYAFYQQFELYRTTGIFDDSDSDTDDEPSANTKPSGSTRKTTRKRIRSRPS